MTAEDSGTSMFGTLVSDMQSNVVVEDNRITGTLKYLSEGSLVDTWGPGYFIALNLADNDYSDLTSVKVGMDPSVSSGLVEIINDPDKNGAFKVTNKNQKFKIVQSDGTHTETTTYDLGRLVLEPRPVDDDAEAEG